MTRDQLLHHLMLIEFSKSQQCMIRGLLFCDGVDAIMTAISINVNIASSNDVVTANVATSNEIMTSVEKHVEF